MKYWTVFISVLCMFLLFAGCNKDNGVSVSQLRIISVSPNILAVGDRDILVQILGNDFVSVRSVSLGDGINILTMNVPDSAHINVTVEVTTAAAPGTRTVVVSTGTGSAALVDALQVEDNNEKPRASFKVEPKSGNELTKFSFDGSESTDSDGEIKSYEWDFGDGSTRKGSAVTHSFSEAGDFVVRLTVKDDRNIEGSTTRNVHVWSASQAIKEIDAVCKEFLKLFEKIETLSAEEIVVGFSKNSDCPGRRREIDIIEKHQAEDVGTTNVDILGNTVVTDLQETKANAYLTARFYGVHRDGTPFDGVATHYFKMVLEDDGWKICDFTVESGSPIVSNLLNP